LAKSITQGPQDSDEFYFEQNKLKIKSNVLLYYPKIKITVEQKVENHTFINHGGIASIEQENDFGVSHLFLGLL